jgi:shikimate dehydrogenase
MTITGKTRLYAIVGDPIAQVRSPQVFTERFAAAGVDAVLVPVHVPSDRFDTAIPGLLDVANLDGLLVTVPFKARMVPFARRLGAAARAVGAVNALRRDADGSWTADMFDGTGFVRGAERKGARVSGRRVALFGAGGAGSAIACALANAGVASVDVIDTEASKARLLVDRLAPLFPRCAFRATEFVSSDRDMVVNASPVGMRPDDGLPGAIGSLDPSTLVGDVVIADPPTALIRLAIRCGCGWVDGRDMHGGQVDALMAFFAAARSSAIAGAHEPLQSS